MPRYFFNIHDGVAYPDREGSDHPDWESAQREAITVAGSMIADNARRKELGEDWQMEVTDEAGLILFRLDFHVALAPVLSGRNEPT